jgi:hypothetical protein
MMFYVFFLFLNHEKTIAKIHSQVYSQRESQNQARGFWLDKTKRTDKQAI